MNKKLIRITGTNAIVFMIPIIGYNENWRCGRVWQTQPVKIFREADTQTKACQRVQPTEGSSRVPLKIRTGE